MITDPAERQQRARELIAKARFRIETAVQTWKPAALFAMFSGGHDSLTCTGVANFFPFSADLTGTVHINTGIGVPETRVFVRETCQERGWRLLEYKALENCQADGTPDPQDYRTNTRVSGTHGHQMMYSRLKQRQIQRLCRDYKKQRNDVIMLIAGCRSEESVRRMRNTKPCSKEKGTCRVWVNPIHDFTKADCHLVMEFLGLRRSPVVDLIHKSGECLCGAFASKGELAELALWFPAVAAEIRALEAEVKAKFGWGWEGRPPTACQRKKITAGQLDMPLCHNCLVENPTLQPA